MEKDQTISGQRFDQPLIVSGGVSGEPERYLAEKPFELSKYEFGVLRKACFPSRPWSQRAWGATGGLVLGLLGKALHALIQKQTPSVQAWELWAVGAGIVIGLTLRFWKKPADEKEYEEVSAYINDHFVSNPRRRVHLVGREERG